MARLCWMRKAAVDLHLAVVVHPGHAEHQHALGLDQALEQAVGQVLRVLRDVGPEAFHDLGHGLQVLGLSGVALGDIGQETLGGGVLHSNPSIFQIGA
jgi:hypothetical protein